jgi:hypothetical protein
VRSVGSHVREATRRFESKVDCNECAVCKASDRFRFETLISVRQGDHEMQAGNLHVQLFVYSGYAEHYFGMCSAYCATNAVVRLRIEIVNNQQKQGFS